MVYKVYLYKRGIGIVNDMLRISETAKDAMADTLEAKYDGFMEEYDGIIVCDKYGNVKGMYGYCGI